MADIASCVCVCVGGGGGGLNKCLLFILFVIKL